MPSNFLWLQLDKCGLILTIEITSAPFSAVCPSKNSNKRNFRCPLFVHSQHFHLPAVQWADASVYKQMCWQGSGHAARLAFSAWRAKCELRFDFHLLNRHLPKDVKCQNVFMLLKALHCFKKIESSFPLKTLVLICSIVSL